MTERKSGIALIPVMAAITIISFAVLVSSLFSTQAWASESLTVNCAGKAGVLKVLDSGKSALPDDAAKRYYYSHIAPKSQTSYKLMYNVTKPIKKAIKEQKRIKAVANSVMAIGAASGGLAVTLKNAQAMAIGTVTSGAGGILYLISDSVLKSLKNIDKKVSCRCKVYFKWTNASRLEYSVKTTYCYEYKNKRVSPVRTIERKFAL